MIERRVPTESSRLAVKLSMGRTRQPHPALRQGNRAYGNVLAGVAFLTGMAAEELLRRELDTYDELFPLLIGVRAVRGA